MHLVNVHTRELESFLVTPPPYAILSHRWGSQELNFKDVLKKRADKLTHGFQKLVDACRIASQFELDWLWIDTCCIDKRSSAELSEAINSMYSWYENADICLAYLEDVEDTQVHADSFVESAWFSRSWTLQELIAPEYVIFYSRNWQIIGTKGSKVEAIKARTGIPDYILEKTDDLWQCSIAERMSWASDRRATRPEDTSYSLMGIFDVNMPLLYGEGDKAFLRLQEEIIRHAKETTFLCWGLYSTASNVFASSPNDFEDVKYEQVLPSGIDTTSLSLTNIGLDLEIAIARYGLYTYAVIVARSFANQRTLIEYAMLLRKTSLQPVYRRLGIVRIDRHIPPSEPRRITIERGAPGQELSDDIELSRLEHEYSIHIRSDPLLRISPCATCHHNRECIPSEMTTLTYTETDSEMHCVFPYPALPQVVRFQCTLCDNRTLWFEIAYDFEWELCFLVSDRSERVSSYKHLTQPSVYDLSAAIPRERPSGWRHEQVLAQKVVDDDTDGLFYFFRKRGLDCSGQIPPRLTAGATPVRFTLTRPHGTNNDTNSGLLTLSLAHPVNGERS